jgi:hypothetical protein
MPRSVACRRLADQGPNGPPSVGRLALGAALAHSDHSETLPLTALPSVAEQALKAANAICWDALSRGDIGAFVREVAICVELWQFTICAGLLEDPPDR